LVDTVGRSLWIGIQPSSGVALGVDDRERVSPSVSRSAAWFIAVRIVFDSSRTLRLRRGVARKARS
jgi:hypothetical protein